MVTLQEAGEASQQEILPEHIERILAIVQEVFGFDRERNNRIVRFFNVLNAYKLGKPVNDIEKQYGCTKSTILRYARLAGLEKRPRGVSTEVREKVIALYRLGLPIAQIQAQCGVSQAYISTLAVKEGISRYKDTRCATR